MHNYEVSGYNLLTAELVIKNYVCKSSEVARAMFLQENPMCNEEILCINKDSNMIQ